MKRAKRIPTHAFVEWWRITTKLRIHTREKSKRQDITRTPTELSNTHKQS